MTLTKTANIKLLSVPKEQPHKIIIYS